MEKKTNKSFYSGKCHRRNSSLQSNLKYDMNLLFKFVLKRKETLYNTYILHRLWQKYCPKSIYRHN